MLKVKDIWTLILFLIVLLSQGILGVKVQAATQAIYYVDTANGNDYSNNGITINTAFRTIERARQQVDTINDNMTGDIYVYLRGGTYSVTDTDGIRFGQSDSGTNGYNIVYKAYANEKPVISGGQSLTGGWTLHDSSKGIWKKTGVNWSFRQLYVNGKWATRSRMPNLNNEHTGGAYYSTLDNINPYDISISGTNIGTWANNGRCEIVKLNHWSQTRARINNYTVNGDTATVYLKSPENDPDFIDFHKQDKVSFYFENAYELIDTEGEWFLDTSNSTLYYKPRNGEDIANVEIIAPKVETLINLTGTASDKVHNLQFYGITLKHNNWVAPDSYGYITYQGGHLLSQGGGVFSAVTGAVDIRYANNIKVERCNITLGGSWGIMEHDGCDHNAYVGNVFSYLASGAITLGNHNSLCGFGALPGTAAYDLVKNNLIDNIGYYYRDAVAINVLSSKFVTIETNEIRNTPYTGISIGFEWDDSGNQDSHDNLVLRNRLYNVMQLLDDGGGIYTLGQMLNTIFAYNYIGSNAASLYNGGYPIAGVYLDQGSRYKNIVYNVIDQWPMTTNAYNAPIGDNVGRENFYNNSNVGRTQGYSDWTSNTSCYGTPWSQQAKEIINNAGIEVPYRDIGDVTLGYNVAIEGTASASSTYPALSPANANDNNCESGLWASDGVESNPYWQVDLGIAHRIYQVELDGRRDVDQPTSRCNFSIRASNDPDFGTFTELANVGNTVAFDFKGLYSVVVNNPLTFRYVRIQRINDAGHFNFAECKVYGIPDAFSAPVDYKARWALNNNGNDEKGSYHFTVCSGIFNSNIKMEGTQSLEFTTNTQYAKTTGIVTTLTDNFSISAWVNWGGDTGTSQIVMYNGNTGTNGYGIILNSSNKLEILVGGKSYLVSDVTLPIGQWSNIIVTRRDGIWKLYKNGIEVSITNSNMTPNTPSGYTQISDSPQYFKGMIDDVRIYERALTSNEIDALSNPFIKARWRLENNGDEDTGNYALDLNNPSFDSSDRIEGTYSLDCGINHGFATTNLVTNTTDNLTISAWLNWKGATGNAQFVLYNGNPGTNGYGIIIDQSDKLNIMLGGINYLVSDAVLPKNQWAHIVVLRKAGIWKLYKNGIEVPITNSTLAPNLPSQYTTQISDVNYFNGKIDDVRIYEGALSYHGISALYAVASNVMLRATANLSKKDGLAKAEVVINNLFKKEGLTYILALAFYSEDGRILSVKKSDSKSIGSEITQDVITQNIPSGTNMFKVFVWDSEEKIIPLCPSISSK